MQKYTIVNWPWGAKTHLNGQRCKPTVNNGYLTYGLPCRQTVIVETMVRPKQLQTLSLEWEKKNQKRKINNKINEKKEQWI